MKKDFITNLLFLAIIIVLVVLAFFVARPFILAIISGFLLAFIFFPLYNLLCKYIKGKRITSFLTIIIVLILVIIPSYIIIKNVSSEALSMYQNVKNKLSDRQSITSECLEQDSYCSFFQSIKKVITSPKIKPYIDKIFARVTNAFVQYVSEFFVSLPKLLLNIFIALFTMYYVLIDGLHIKNRIIKLFPMKMKHKTSLYNKLKEVSYAVIYGQVITAIIQGLIAVIGYYIFGISSPWFLAGLTALVALIPVLGTFLVWGPVSIYIFLIGFATGNNSMIVRGVGLFAYGMLVISTIDNFIRPKLMSHKAKVHPVVVLVGVLGGIMLFGIIGIFLGPLILSLFFELVRLYEEGKLVAARD